MFFLPLIVLVTPIIPAVFNFGYEHIKVVFFVIGVSLAGLNWLYRENQNREEKIPNIHKISLIFLASLLVTALLGTNSQNSIFGIPPYFQGVILYAYLLLFSFLVSKYYYPLINWSKVITVSSTIVALIAIFQYLQINLFHLAIPTYAGRVVSTFGQPNFYSGFLLINLPFLYYLICKTRKKNKIWILLLIFVNVLAILLSQSRASILILAAALGFWAYKNINGQLRILLVSLMVILAFGAVFYSLNQKTGVIYSELVEPQSEAWLAQNSPEKRLYLWQIFINLILEKPVLGYGLENLKDAYSAYFLKFNPETTQLPPYYFTVKNIIVDRAHNYPMDLILSSGIFGLICWVLIVCFLLKRVKNKILLGSLLVYLFWVQFQNQSVVNLIQFWLLAGLISVDKG